jgi:single-stranded DNA-binding protein
MAVPLADKKRDDSREDYWFTLEAWGRSDDENTPANFMLNCHKGQEVEIRGRVKTNTYTDRNNETKTSVVIRVVDIFLVGSITTPPAPTTAQPRTPAQSRPPAPTPGPASWLTSGSENHASEEEVPF